MKLTSALPRRLSSNGLKFFLFDLLWINRSRTGGDPGQN